MSLRQALDVTSVISAVPLSCSAERLTRYFEKSPGLGLFVSGAGKQQRFLLLGSLPLAGGPQVYLVDGKNESALLTSHNVPSGVSDVLFYVGYVSSNGAVNEETSC